MLDAMLRVMLGVMLHASWYKSSTSRFMTLIMLHVLLLGMLHVMLLRGMIIVMLLCFIPCAFQSFCGCQAWTSVD